MITKTLAREMLHKAQATRNKAMGLAENIAQDIDILFNKTDEISTITRISLKALHKNVRQSVWHATANMEQLMSIITAEG